MTKKEKWKQAICEYLLTGPLLDKVKDEAKLRYVKLTSVETKSKLRERIRCPYCFEQTQLVLDPNAIYSGEIKCGHCDHVFAKSHSVGKDSISTVSFGDNPCLREEIVLVDAATICGEYGLIYANVYDANAVYIFKEKKVRASMNIKGFGFLSKECRFYYRSGGYTTCSIESMASCWTNIRFTDDALELLNHWNNREHTVDRRNALYRIQDMEHNLRYSISSKTSTSLKKASQILEEDPVCSVDELPLVEYTGIRTRFVSYDQMKRESTCIGYCYNCNSKFRIKSLNHYGSEKCKCPNCGTEEFVFRDDRELHDNEFYIDRTKNGDYVVRAIEIALSPGTDRINVSRKEAERVYIRTGSETIMWDRLLSNPSGEMRYSKSQEAVSIAVKKKRVTLSDDAKEGLKYSGLLEYIEAEKLNDSVSLISIAKYIAVWQKHPFVEKLAKLGWRRMVDDIIRDVLSIGEMDFDEDANELHSVLRLDKLLFRYFADRYIDPSKHDLSEIRMYYDMDRNVQPQDVEWCQNEKIATHTLREIIDILGISVHQACEYLERVRISQCFSPAAAATEWRDYLRASQTIEVDLNDKTVRYPSSLKREHDRAVFKQKIILDAKKEEVFQKVCREYGEKYAYEDDNYSIIAPASMHDLFEEGRKLNHCVGSYADRIISGHSCVCFIRQKKNPEAPFFTMEIYSEQDRVSQIHGLSNRNVDPRREKELVIFLKDWAKKKRLALPAA